jgi:hypothetical protein
MRCLVLLALALGCASCAYPQYNPQGTVLLSNPGSEHVAVETVVTAYPDCDAKGGGFYGEDRFSLPPDGTRFISVPPGAGVCWRIAPPAGKAEAEKAEWNRIHVFPGGMIASSI